MAIGYEPEAEGRGPRQDASATLSRMSAAEDLDLGAVRRLRRQEYDQLVEAGAFEGERVELVEGMVMTMAPHGPEHAGTIDDLVERLRAVLGERALVRAQSAFAATATSCPEPDVAVVPRRSYREAHPTEAFLIVEVAKSSLKHDTHKARVYAAAGVPEYWIVDLEGRRLVVHRQPKDGAYEEITTHRAPESMALVAFPDVSLPLADFL